MTDKDINNWYDRPIKKMSSEDIEKVIAKAISDATSEEYEVEIKTLDFNPNTNALSNDATEIKILISKKWKSSFDRQDEQTT